jgi:hypothetical protein
MEQRATGFCVGPTEQGFSGGRSPSAASPELDGGHSDTLDGDSVGIGRQCLEILRIRGQHRTPRFGCSYNQRIHRRASARTAPQKSRSPCETLTNLLDNVASLEESIFRGVPSSVTLKAFDKNHRRYERRP